MKDKIFIIAGAVLLTAILFGAISTLCSALPSNVSTVLEAR